MDALFEPCEKLRLGPVVLGLAENNVANMNCRVGCGACCIAPSISSPIPGMPNGKAAGERCVQLDVDNRCKLFGDTERPTICRLFQASEEMCGSDFDEAMNFLHSLELMTR